MKNILSLKITADLILAIAAGSWVKNQTPFSLGPIQNAIAYLESNQRSENSLQAIALWAGETGYDVGPPC